jgi:hypothetical protein
MEVARFVTDEIPRVETGDSEPLTETYKLFGEGRSKMFDVGSYQIRLDKLDEI